MKTRMLLGLLLLVGTLPVESQTPWKTNPFALAGLAPVTTLSKTAEGNAALAANYAVTGGIQMGTIRLPGLSPFFVQQQQALRDVVITSNNLTQLADGLGTTLGDAYGAAAHYDSAGTGHWTNISQNTEDVIGYATAATAADAGTAKFLFGNETKNGTVSVPDDAKQIITRIGGSPDPFGRAYGFPAGAPGADPYGNSRPFQTEPSLLLILGPDYYHAPSDSYVYNHGPMMDLTKSPSYPRGHTTYGYTGAVVLALLVPARYQQMITRGAEYGNSRILVGAHYAMDVIAGRTLALYDMAHLLGDDHDYVGRTLQGAPVISNFRETLLAARNDVTKALQSACGEPIEKCALEDTGRFNSPAANEAFYGATQTYDLPVVHPENVGKLEDVSKLAPEAQNLLTVAFPKLSIQQAERILTETEGPGGGFLDDGSSFGIYSRLDLYAAAGKAAQLVASQ